VQSFCSAERAEVRKLGEDGVGLRERGKAGPPELPPLLRAVLGHARAQQDEQRTGERTDQVVEESVVGVREKVEASAVRAAGSSPGLVSPANATGQAMPSAIHRAKT